MPWTLSMVLLAGESDADRIVGISQHVPLVLAKFVVGQQLHLLDALSPSSAMNWPSPSALSSSSDQVGTTT